MENNSYIMEINPQYMNCVITYNINLICLIIIS